jgi:hypothetical protein
MYMNHTLESHKFFPVVAWVLVVSFTLFTVTLTYQLKEAAEGFAPSYDLSQLQ